MKTGTSRSLVVLSFAVAACGAPPAPAPIASPPIVAPAADAAAAEGPVTATPPEKLAADSPRTTFAGATFTAPGGWTIATKGPATTLDAPEGDLHLALVDVKAADADTAVAAAWTAYRPESKRPLRIATLRSARNGWDEVRSYEYEVSPNEKLVVYAAARRRGDMWTVTITEGSEGTFEKRISNVALVRDSLRPKGYERESFAGKKANPLDAARIKIIGEFVESAMKELGVPGAAVALIDGGKVVFEGGFGVRELGKPKPVDAETDFIIASNTKGMTTLLLAKLVDEGKLTWDTPVVSVMPTFKLGDADTTSKVLVKNLVCACTGLPRQDTEWLFEFKSSTPKSTMDLLGTMQPTSKFGEMFQYSNILAAAAGFVAAHVLHPKKELGAAYDDAMREKVFAPLGMKGTTFDFAVAERGDHARPHADDADGVPRVAKMDVNRGVIPVRPAGGAWSSVHDVAKYVQMELAKGLLPDGKRYVSEASLLARRAPQVSVGESATYGMGLFVDTRWKVPVVHHGGALIGYRSDLMFLPDHGVGAVILTNSDNGGAMLRPFMRRLLEVLFDGKPEALEDMQTVAKTMRAERGKWRERLAIPADPTAAAKLAAHYTSPQLGEVKVKRDGVATVFDLGEWRSAVATRKNDDGTISFITIEPGIDGTEFVVAERDGKRVLLVRDAQHEYVLTEAK